METGDEHPQFSAAELDLLQNADLFPTKNNITQKLIQILQSVQEAMMADEEFQRFPWPAEVDFTSGKISRGENYQGQPYLILDFPRYFNKEGVFALRSFFWWGNYFALFLQVSGKQLDPLLPTIRERWRELPDFTLVDTGSDPWLYDLSGQEDGSTVWTPAKGVSQPPNADFLKLGASFELLQYESLPQRCSSAASQWLQWLR